jgi:predicted Zn-dependent peptidase
MFRIAQAELMRGEVRSMAEHLDRIDAVTLDDVRVLAAELLTAAPALAVVGPYDSTDRFSAVLN